MSDKGKRTQEVSVELAAAAQAAYVEAQKKEQADKGQPAKLGLASGWGGKGR